MRQVTAKLDSLTGPVKVATALMLAPGHIFVSADDEGTPDLPGGRRVVPVTDKGGPLELLTSETLPSVTDAGVYLDASDLGKLGGATAGPKLRAYGFKDTWRKMRSGAGVLLAVGAITTLATPEARAGLFLAFPLANNSAHE